MPNLPRPIVHELVPNEWHDLPGPPLKWRCLGCGTTYGVRTRQPSCRLPTIQQINEYAGFLGAGYPAQIEKLVDAHLKKLHWLKWQRESSIQDWLRWKRWKETLAAQPPTTAQPLPAAPKADKPAPKAKAPSTNGQFLTRAMKRRRQMGLPPARQPGEPADWYRAKQQQAEQASQKEA